MKSKLLLLILTVLIVSAGGLLIIKYINKAGTKLQGTECKSNVDCPLISQKGCRGPELCVPLYVPFCDNGTCRLPKNDKEWEIACSGKDEYDKESCFEYFFEMSKKNYKTLFGYCDRNFSDSDVESCKLNACGFDPAYPDISPGDAKCVKEALSSSCNDGIRNGRETAIDCGGQDCGKCSGHTSCQIHSDCKSGICNVSGFQNRDTCLDICPNGPIKTSAPCGCFTKDDRPQGYELRTVTDWEKQYGQDRTIFCCNGQVNTLKVGSSCPQ